VIDLGRGCARFRPLLVDFVDRGEVQPETGGALAHLDQCSRCTEAIESTVLTITALRRIGDDAASVAAEPEPDAWPRLRVRIEGWKRRPRVMSPLAGMAMSFAIVAVLVMPLRLGGSLLGSVASPEPPRSTAGGFVERRIEAAYIAAVRTGSLGSSGGSLGSNDESLESTAESAGSYPRIYPDNYRPPRKEVTPGEPAGRPPEAI
jgi:anti-sigma factor RsiW